MARALYPAFLDFSGRRVLVVGGGSVATAKAARLAGVGAEVIVVSPRTTPELDAIAHTIHRRPFTPADLDDVWYVVSAAPPDVNARVQHAASTRRLFVNAVDDPASATAFAGSTFSRGPVTVAISTGGEAPALARVMREALERLIGSDVEDWSARAAKLRDDWRREQLPMERRRDALLESLAQLHLEATGRAALHGRGRLARLPTSQRRRNHATGPDAHRHSGGVAANRYGGQGVGSVSPGLVSLVGAGPGDPELLTRMAARRLAESDLVLYDALVSEAVLSLATRAQRICVGRRRGSDTIGQDAIVRTLIRASRRGRRVVRLKGGDPFLFARGGEEALALAAAGVPFEVVPGVSSALAAPALASIPVTHRGLSSAVLVTTGHDPERFAALVDGVAPATVTLVILMGTSQREALVASLTDNGWAASTPAAIIWNASHRDARVWAGRLDGLARAPSSGDAPGTIVIGDVVALREPLSSRHAPNLVEVRHAVLCRPS